MVLGFLRRGWGKVKSGWGRVKGAYSRFRGWKSRQADRLRRAYGWTKSKLSALRNRFRRTPQAVPLSGQQWRAKVAQNEARKQRMYNKRYRSAVRASIKKYGYNIYA